MPRTVAYIPFYTSASAPESLVTSRDIGLKSMEDDFIYGVYGPGERSFLDRAMPWKPAQDGLMLRKANICLNVAPKFTGVFDPTTGIERLKLFAGEDDRSDVQAAVGAVWLAVAKEAMQAQGKDPRWLPRNVDFRRASDYLQNLPQHAAEVARRAGFIAMILRLELFGSTQRPRVIMIQRKFVRYAVAWAEFEDRLSSVAFHVPSSEGDQILELARMARRQFHVEYIPTTIISGPIQRAKSHVADQHLIVGI